MTDLREWDIMQILKRELCDKLLKWRRTSAGSTAALMEGPKCVGKSTLAEQFAKAEYRSHLIIDFRTAPHLISRLFDDISDLDYLFVQLQLQTGVRLYPRESPIVFDEVQLCPRARQAIKFLVMDGRYDYLETGSFISIRRNVANINIPSEERRFQLRPLDYEEFLWAQGNEATVPLLRSIFDRGTKIDDGINQKLMRDYRLSMLVGGMPQAVAAYLETRNLQVTDEIKHDIISVYEDGFMELDPKGSLSALFDAIPSQLTHASSRYHVSSVLPNARVSDVLGRIEQLIASRTVLVAHHVSDPGIGSSQMYDPTKFKLYLCDTGLFVTLAYKDTAFCNNDLYAGLLSDKVTTKMGCVYKQAVAQELAAKGNRLLYHTWQNPVAKRNHEVDFIVPHIDKISPVEVKSSKRQHHASLGLFCQKYSSRISTPFLVSVTDWHSDGRIRAIPAYMAQFL